MLRRPLRLSSTRDFDRVYQRGEQVSSRNLRIFRLPAALRENQNQTRFGFVVSKKQATKIVRRNRIKRLLRNLVSRHLASFPKGQDYILQGKIGIDQVSEWQLRAEFMELIGKLSSR